MLRLSIILLATVLVFSSCATPRPWTKGEKISAYYFCVAHFADAYTTNQMLDNGYHENNPVLGEYPSDSKVTIYFSLTGAAALVLGHFWPELRKPLFIGYGTLNAGCAIYNSQLD